MSTTYSPCLEWLFADGDREFPDRIRAAAQSGFRQIEFWTTTDKDVEALERAVRETHVSITAFVSEPTGQLVDPATHADFLRGVRRSSDLAVRVNARNLIVVSGNTRPDVERGAQADAIVEALRHAAPIAAGSGVGLLLEPLNSRVDHRDYFLDSTMDALDVIRRVHHPAVRLLYDVYHSVVMGEDLATVLTGAGHLIGHVHLADVPGRHEPGTGVIDWPVQLSALRAAGYSGILGLEYRPTRDTTASLAYVSGVVDPQASKG